MTPPTWSHAKLQSEISDPEVVERLASVVGACRKRRFRCRRSSGRRARFLERLAGERPVLVIIDDIQWAEPTFLELLDSPGRNGGRRLGPAALHQPSRAPRAHARLGQGRPGHPADGARPLSDADAGRVVEGLLGGTGLTDGVQARIPQGAAGNPLFVEQLLSMLIDDGTLRRDGDRWEQVGDLSRR